MDGGNRNDHAEGNHLTQPTRGARGFAIGLFVLVTSIGAAYATLDEGSLDHRGIDVRGGQGNREAPAATLPDMRDQAGVGRMDQRPDRLLQRTPAAGEYESLDGGHGPSPTPEPTPEPPTATPTFRPVPTATPQQLAVLPTVRTSPGSTQSDLAAFACSYPWPCQEALNVMIKESGGGWAVNPSSGACGPMQHLPCVHFGDAQAHFDLAYQKWVTCNGGSFYCHWYKWW